MSSEPRDPATISPETGIEFCKTILADIRSCDSLSDHPFGIDVSNSVRSVMERLQDGAFFSLKMEGALNGWYSGVSKWVDRGDRNAQ